MRLGLAIAFLIPCGAAWGNDCTSIRFQRGTSGTVVTGTAYSETMTCYTLGTRAGQTATVEIIESGGEDTAFNIADLSHDSYIVDNRDKYSFQTVAGTYRIDVYRTFARGEPVPFKMAVSVR